MHRTITNTSLVRLLSTLLNFVVALIVSRYLGPKLKGDATIILTSISFVVFFCSIVGGHQLVYLVPRLKTENLVVPAYVWTLMVCCAAYFVLSFFHFFTLRRSLNIALLSLLFSVVNIHASLLLAKQQIKKYNWLYIVPVLLTVVVLPLLLQLYPQSIYAYIYALYIAYGVTAFISFVLCFSYVRVPSLSSVFADMDESFKHGSSYQLLELLQLLCFRFYFYLLYHLQGAYDLGLYSIGISLVEFTWLFARSVSIVHYVDFSNHHNHAVSLEQSLRYLKLSLLVSGILLLVLAATPASVYGFVFGEFFMYSKYLVKWLMPGVLLYNITLVLQSYYLSRAEYSCLIGVHVLALLACIIACYTLIPRYYFSGASAAASLSFCISSTLLFFFFKDANQLPWRSFLINASDVKFYGDLVRNTLGRK